MTHEAKRPKKIIIEFESTSQGWDSHTISNKHYMDGFNQCHDLDTAYLSQLLEPLEGVNEDIIEDFINPNYDLTHVIRLSNKMKEAIQSVIRKHRRKT